MATSLDVIFGSPYLPREMIFSLDGAGLYSYNWSMRRLIRMNGAPAGRIFFSLLFSLFSGRTRERASRPLRPSDWSSSPDERSEIRGLPINSRGLPIDHRGRPGCRADKS